jgi:hypothetical protein
MVCQVMDCSGYIDLKFESVSLKFGQYIDFICIMILVIFPSGTEFELSN